MRCMAQCNITIQYLETSSKVKKNYNPQKYEYIIILLYSSVRATMMKIAFFVLLSSVLFVINVDKDLNI